MIDASALCDPTLPECSGATAQDPITQTIGPVPQDPCAPLAGDPVSYQHCESSLSAYKAGTSLPPPLTVSPWDALLAALPQAPTSSGQFWSGIVGVFPGGAGGLTLALTIGAAVLIVILLHEFGNPRAA